MFSNSQFILLYAVSLSELPWALFAPIAQMMPHALDTENHINRWFPRMVTHTPSSQEREWLYRGVIKDDFMQIQDHQALGSLRN